MIAAHVKGVPLEAIRASRDRVVVGDAEIPLLPDGTAMINYQGGAATRPAAGKQAYESFYTYLPYESVIASADLVRAGEPPLLPSGTFRDKIVLITASAAGLSDFRATPFSPVTPGIEIHANIIDNVLSKRFLRKLTAPQENGYIVALAVLVGVLSAAARPWVGGVAAGALSASVIGLHWTLFAYGWVLPVVPASAAMLGTYLGVVVLKYVKEEREKKRIRATFGHYLAPQVLDEVLKSPDRLRLGGERRTMTVLFSDVEGFTWISEKLAAEDMSAVLSDYFTRMMPCITATGGTLDKFVGDGVMAEWNAPAHQDDHAARACDTALLMMEEVKRLRERWRDERHVALNVRIGINTGEMVVGNMGSKEIFDYTVIGNEVNVAARLEPLNKDFGTSIAVAESTRREAELHRPDRFVFRRLARVTLKGRVAPVDVHELVGWQGQIDADHREAIDAFERGLDLFQRAEFVEARNLFARAIDRHPGDGPSGHYVDLCAHHEEHPVPATWRGIHVQRSK